MHENERLFYHKAETKKQLVYRKAGTKKQLVLPQNTTGWPINTTMKTWDTWEQKG